MDEPRDRHSLSSEVVVLPLPGPRASIPAPTEFRSTWIVSSLEGLRMHGHFDRYYAALQAHHDEIVSCVAGSWLPLSVVRAHYEACQSLALTPADLDLMAREGGSVRRAWHAAIVAAAQKPGANIWNVLPQLHKLWLRSANGGAAAVYQRSPTYARVEYVGCELFDIEYFREAVRVVLVILGSHMCQRITVRTQPQSESGCVEYHLDWI